MASENFDTYQAPQLRGFNRVALPPEEPKLTAAQSAYIAANLVPGAGYADFVGAMSEMPEAGVPVSQALVVRRRPDLLRISRQATHGSPRFRHWGSRETCCTR